MAIALVDCKESCDIQMSLTEPQLIKGKLMIDFQKVLDQNEIM